MEHEALRVSRARFACRPSGCIKVLIPHPPAFKVYLMFRPDGGDGEAIWVTLSRGTWSWRGTARYVAGRPQVEWVLTNDRVVGSTGSSSSELPRWTARFQDQNATTSTVSG